MQKSKGQVTLFVGDIHESLATTAKEYDSAAFLINHNNYKQFLTTDIDTDITVYTSLGDLPKDLEIFYNIALSARKIVYTPPAVWSDHLTVVPFDPTRSIQGLTESLLLSISNYRPVENLDLCYFKPAAVPLIDQRKSSSAQLWVAGGSMTSAIGVAPDQRYGQLVANALDMPCSFLAQPGSSISWAADQILRSDINSGDIVIWEVTITERVNLINQDHLIFVNPLSYTKDPEIEKHLPITTLSSETTFYSHLYAIEQVINFCKKNNIILILLGLMNGTNMLRYLKSKNNYFHFPHRVTVNDNHLKDIY